MNKARKILVNVCRVIFAMTLIFSGYVKAIDPLGTQYKIQDYLSAAGIGNILPDWIVLAFSIGLAALEFSLGVFVLLAIRRRQSSKVACCLMTVMTLITIWIAIADPVKDCGCFGDAIVLSNTQTLVKNIILLGCAWMLVLYPTECMRILPKKAQWIIINITVIFILLSSIWSLYYLPPIDFRPYHIGANIKKGMEIPEGAEMPQFETTFIMEKDGQRKEFSLENYPDSTWTFIDSKTIQTKEGYTPPIHDFSIEDRKTGVNITSQVLNDKGFTFLLISPHLEKADDSNFGEIDQIYEFAQEQGCKMYCLTASGDQAIQRWIDMTGAEYPFCNTDEITLKTIIRSNPGLVLIKDATIIGKWSHNDLPNQDEIKKIIKEN